MMRLVREYFDIKSPSAVLLGTQKPRPQWANNIDTILSPIGIIADIVRDWPILTLISAVVIILSVYELSH